MQGGGEAWGAGGLRGYLFVCAFVLVEGSCYKNSGSSCLGIVSARSLSVHHFCGLCFSLVLTTSFLIAAFPHCLVYCSQLQGVPPWAAAILLTSDVQGAVAPLQHLCPLDCGR